MKKTVLFLFLIALFFVVAGAAAVSCQKGEEEEDVPKVGAGSRPKIDPTPIQSGSTYTIEVDGTIISRSSSGYSFFVQAGAITFKSFTCVLASKERFTFLSDCNLTLNGASIIRLSNGGLFGGSHVTLSGNGSITIKKINLNVTYFDKLFSAAEGYTLTSSGKVDEGNNWYSCTWMVEKDS
ncbi:MAG: hypothetical protein IJV01_07090 [Bacteroidales bacterium]|nr:hypothetical protein [Bacteroidales bacterium]